MPVTEAFRSHVSCRLQFLINIVGSIVYFFFITSLEACGNSGHCWEECIFRLSGLFCSLRPIPSTPSFRYPFEAVPHCNRDLSGSVVLRIGDRSMLTHAVRAPAPTYLSHLWFAAWIDPHHPKAAAPLPQPASSLTGKCSCPGLSPGRRGIPPVPRGGPAAGTAPAQGPAARGGAAAHAAAAAPQLPRRPPRH